VDSYTLADLARVTGAKRRSLQLWADADLIVAEKGTNRAGTGTHRLFSRQEAIIACITHAFALHQIAIGELLRIAAALRVWIQFDFMFTGDKPKDIIEEAIKGEGSAVLVYESWRGRSKGPRLSARTSQPIAAGDEAGVQHAISIFRRDRELKFLHLRKQEGFSSVIYLRNYLSKIDS